MASCSRAYTVNTALPHRIFRERLGTSARKRRRQSTSTLPQCMATLWKFQCRSRSSVCGAPSLGRFLPVVLLSPSAALRPSVEAPSLELLWATCAVPSTAHSSPCELSPLRGAGCSRDRARDWYRHSNEILGAHRPRNARAIHGNRAEEDELS